VIRKTCYWGVATLGALDLQLIAFRIDGPSWFGFHLIGMVRFNTFVGMR
jgi:hypothetical protein